MKYLNVYIIYYVISDIVTISVDKKVIFGERIIIERKQAITLDGDIVK